MKALAMKALHELGVLEAAAAIRTGDITSERLCEALLSRAEALAGLNAFAALDASQVLAAARDADRARGAGQLLPPLHGVPIALKDNINTTALPTSAGTPALRHHRPAHNAPVAQALFDAGAILFGKVGMHELAFGITSNNAAFGAIRNPYDAGKIPGGSSGGSGAAVGARLVPASIGSDTGGSVRVPSAFCGAFGFRPTVHRWPQAGIVPISATRDTAGPLARSVADLVALDGAVTGQPMDVPVRLLPGVRIGIPRTHFWDDLEDETRRLCETALAMLKDAGAILIEADVPDVRALDESSGFSIALYEVARDLDRYLKGEGLSLRFADVVAATASPDVRGILGSLLDPKTAIPDQVYRFGPRPAARPVARGVSRIFCRPWCRCHCLSDHAAACARDRRGRHRAAERPEGADLPDHRAQHRPRQQCRHPRHQRAGRTDPRRPAGRACVRRAGVSRPRSAGDCHGGGGRAAAASGAADDAIGALGSRFRTCAFRRHRRSGRSAWRWSSGRRRRARGCRPRIAR